MCLVLNIAKYPLTKARVLLLSLFSMLGPFVLLSCGGGLFHCLTSDFTNPSTQQKSKKTVTFQLPQNHQPITLLSTSTDREALFTNEEISCTKAARRLQEEMCWPSDDIFKKFISEGFITHYPITPQDVDRINHPIWRCPKSSTRKNGCSNTSVQHSIISPTTRHTIQ